MNGWSLKVFNIDCGVWQVFGVGSRDDCVAQAANGGKAIERVDERRRVIYAD